MPGGDRSSPPRPRPPESGWHRRVPVVGAVASYQRRWLRRDVLAGIGLAALLIPQGMAYAQLAGLPAVTGLYATVVGLLAYAIFGPSPILIVGPDSALSPLVFATVVSVAGAGAAPDERLAVAGVLTVLLGACCLLAGLARLGALGDLLSMPMRVGYLNGIAVVVLVSQLPKLCGFTTEATDVRSQLRAFVAGLADGRVVPAALAIGLGSLAAIVVLRRAAPRVPGVLLAVGAATLLVWRFGLDVPVTGSIPAGFPRPQLPRATFAELTTLAAAALGMAFVTIADTIALSRAYAHREGIEVDADQELIALGTANIATACFQGFAVSASGSRTAVAASSGGRTQLTGVASAITVVGVLAFANDLTRWTPSAVLAAIVISASFTLFDLPALALLARVRRSELALALATFLGVVLIGALQGIVVAAGLSLANFLRRAWRPYNVALGRIDGRKGYHDVERHPEALEIPGLLLFRFDAPLFFANAGYFSERLAALIADRSVPVQRVIVAAEPISDVDATAAEALRALLDRLDRLGISLVLAELKGPVKDALRRYGLYDRLGDAAFPPTLGTAIDDYVAAYGVAWVDWEDRVDGEGAGGA